MISFCTITVSAVSFFLGGEGGGGGGGVPSLSSSSSSSLMEGIFVGDGSTASGGDRRDLCFRQVLNSVYSSLFFISIARFTVCISVLSMSVCLRYLHQANSAAHECCNLLSSTKDIYSSRLSSENCCMLYVNTF